MTFPMECDTSSWEFSNYWTQRMDGTAHRERVMKDGAEHQPVANLLKQNGVDLGSLLHHAECKKELAFEFVRAREFSAKPSRSRCIFLTTAEVDPLRVLKRMGFEQYLTTRALLRIEIAESGKMHSGDSSFLNCNLLTTDRIFAKARSFWAGEGSPDEILYEGAFKVLGIREPSSSRSPR